MKISKTLEDAIINQNLVGIYSVFYTIAHEDPNFTTGKFNATLEEVKKAHIPGLFQVYNGEVFEGPEKWTEEYWAIVASGLVDNFCEERIEHLKEVGRKVYPSVSGLQKQTKIDEEENIKKKSVKTLQTSHMNPLLIAIIAVALVSIIVILINLKKS